MPDSLREMNPCWNDPMKNNSFFSDASSPLSLLFTRRNLLMSWGKGVWGRDPNIPDHSVSKKTVSQWRERERERGERLFCSDLKWHWSWYIALLDMKIIVTVRIFSHSLRKPLCALSMSCRHLLSSGQCINTWTRRLVTALSLKTRPLHLYSHGTLDHVVWNCFFLHSRRRRIIIKRRTLGFVTSF